MASKNMSSSSSSTSSSSKSSTRTSIHTPLKPASVQDLKAKFDPSKMTNATGSSGSTGSGLNKSGTGTSSSPSSERRAAAQKSGSSSSSGVSLSSVNSSLQAAAQRKRGTETSAAAPSSSASTSSSSSSSFSSSSSVTSNAKSSLALSTPRPFVPSSSSSSTVSNNAKSSTSSSSSSSSSLSSTTATATAANRWEPKGAANAKTTWPATTKGTKGSTNGSGIDEVKGMFEKSKESRIELPVTHVTTSRASDAKNDNKTSRNVQQNTTDNKFRDVEERFNKRPGGFQTRGGIGQKVNESKSVSAADGTNKSSRDSPKTSPRSAKPLSNPSDSPPVQRTKRLVAREITIERLDSGVNVTSYKDLSSSANSKPEATASDSPPSSLSSTKSSSKAKTKASTNTNTTGDAGNKIKEIKVQRLPPSSESKKKEDLPFKQVKLRNTKQQMEKQASNDSAKLLELKPAITDPDNRRISRKISSERFERLMFDFERGVPTEAAPRLGSEHLDHLELQQKARELPNSEQVATPVIAKKNKEESIFKEGLKVSDFVKQVNKMNPEVAEPPKWKVAAQKKDRSQTSSAASSDIGGDNFYQGIPGEDEAAMEGYLEDDYDDDIYEKVNIQVPAIPDEARQNGGGSSPKPPSRRLGVYRKKDKKGSKKSQEKSEKPEAKEEEKEQVVYSDGEDGWEGEDSSSGTEYEDVGQDDEGEEEDLIEEDVYEDLENYCKPASQAPKGSTLTNKLKKIFVNKKKKRKRVPDPAASTGTDSEGESRDDYTEEPDCGSADHLGTFSRTSSQRSSGRGLTKDDHASNGSISTTAATATTNTATNSTTPLTGSLSEEVLSSAAAIASSQTAAASNQQTTTSSSSSTAASATTSTTTSGMSCPPPPPPLPPRATKNLTQTAENSPPLPPRNPSLSHKATLGVPLDMVIPISPTQGKSGSFRDKKKDRFSYGANSQDGSDSGISYGKIEYMDYEPPSAQTLERIEKRKSTTSNRPVSAASSGSSNSSYMYPDMSALSDLHGDNGDNESLYVDLEDEQIYGKASDIYVSRFESEPLYQWYSKDKMVQSIRGDVSSNSGGDVSDEEYLELDRDGDSVYEDVERLLEKNQNLVAPIESSKASNRDDDKKGSGLDAKQRPHRRSIIEDVFNKGGTLHRALWCQMPEVIKSGLLEKLSDQQKKIQEAMFEIMTSEASYLKSLNILISVFLMAPEFSGNMSDRCVITRRDRTTLFSNIGNIRDISAKFLADLEARWQESCHLKDVCDIIVKHASKNFEPYVRYCCNQTFQDRALTGLKQNAEFNEAVKRLELRPECQFLPLASFLLLPMQRVTRLPLLVDAICHRLEAGSAQHTSAKKALECLTKVAKRCDEAAKKMQQTEQMYHLNQNLEFKIKEIPLVSASRFLVKQGELTLLKGDAGTVKKPFSKLLGSHKEHIYLYLFNDMLLVTKKKGSIFQVRDYCQRNSLHAEAIDNPDKSRHIAPGTAGTAQNLMLLAMLANHDNKQVELVVSCKAESERTRWIDAIMPTQSSTETERIYDFWDCPQHQCVTKYLAQQPDELTLEESDAVNVTRKMKDGWYEGERIRDGVKGWFPASHTEEINNSHVRARNLRLRYRLLIASDALLQAEREKR